MNQQNNSLSVTNSYLYHFQEAQQNLSELIREERLLKRIRKSREKVKTDD